MLESLITYVNSFFINYGIFGVFLGSLVEEVIAPIPSTLIIIGSSFFILKGQVISLVSIFTLLTEIILPVAAGMTIGSLFIYGLCYYLGKPFIVKWGKYLGLNWKDIEKTNKKLENQKRDNLAIFTVRAIPIIPSVAISGFCGIIRYDLKKYLILTFIGGAVRAGILGFLGWQFGNFYKEIAMELSNLEEILVIIIAIGIIGYIVYKKKIAKTD